MSDINLYHIVHTSNNSSSFMANVNWAMFEILQSFRFNNEKLAV